MRRVLRSVLAPITNKVAGPFYVGSKHFFRTFPSSMVNLSICHPRGTVKYISAEEAMAKIKSDSNVFLHSVACHPTKLTQAMTARHAELKNVNIYHLHIEGSTPWISHPESFLDVSFFVGQNVRKAVQCGRARYIPVFLSEVPSLFSQNYIPLDYAFISVTPPDRHGYCSLGPSVDVSLAAIRNAKMVHTFYSVLLALFPVFCMCDKE